MRLACLVVMMVVRNNRFSKYKRDFLSHHRNCDVVIVWMNEYLPSEIYILS